jgi:thiol:disulfide interchange protein DsbD
MNKKSALIGFLLAITSVLVQAQIVNPTHWSFNSEGKKVKKGDIVELVFKVKIDQTWHLYSSDFDPNVGPKVSVFTFNKSPKYALVGKINPIGAENHFDDVFGGNVRLFHKKAEFRQKVKILESTSIEGTYESQACSDEIGKCVDQDGDFSFGPFEVENTNSEKAEKSEAEKTSISTINVDSGKKAEAITNTDSLQTVTTSEKNSKIESGVSEVTVTSKAPENSGSLWGFFFAAFLSGLVALLTPCVFPMIPMTVTFFTRQSQTRAEGIRKASLYGLSIIILYVLIGTLVSRINGPEFANFISTHWAPNLFFFFIFIFFGLSFLGLFEIVLPSSIVNMADKQSDKGGIIGIFFMAFTIVLVSFSCTGPIVGSILVQSAGGEVLKPIIGMFGYSLAFALPFTLFAIFPQWLSSLPKSGGWLNSVKVVLGFLELAFALKFLSIADQAYHWHILDREIYLAFWIVIFSMIGFYLLGKIRLPHDSPLEKIPVLRVGFSILVLSFVVYMIPGMWGAPLKALAGYLPPESTLDFNIEALIEKNGGRARTSTDNQESTLCDYPKYAEILHLPHGLEGYFDLKQALACAKAQNKPVFIDFTGHGCVNCREMEANVWSSPEVLKRLENDFIVTALYVDDKTELPENQWYTSKYDGKVKKTIGKQNADIQVISYKSNTQPLYVLLGPDGSLLVEPRSYDLNVEEFVKFLDSGLSKFKTSLK